MDEQIEKIKEVIEQINPFLMADGGSVEFIKYEDDIVYIQVLGACQGCGMLNVTLSEVIEATIMEEIPTVKGVKSINT